MYPKILGIRTCFSPASSILWSIDFWSAPQVTFEPKVCDMGFTHSLGKVGGGFPPNSMLCVP